MLIRPDVPLSVRVDASARFAGFPPDFSIKGMFPARLEKLASHAVLESVRGALLKPEALGRYVSFADYPQVDYSRLAYAVATDLYKRLDPAEAMRRLARRDIETFASSQIGKIMLALTGNAAATLMKLPDMYGAALRGGSVKAVRTDPGTVSIRFRNFYGWLDCYAIGTVEGLVSHFSNACEIEVSLETATAATYIVHLR
jgi:uncharacterized protein (TIGR02265 family)